ncbi:MAG TPA: S9 family peptidase [Bryobacteraceae bacterium]|nr:S9 family peptidase [Bryobacteraceae bacterium]
MKLYLVFAAISFLAPLRAQTWTSADLYKLRSAGEVQLSPDGSRIAYAVVNNDQPGRPYSQTWIMNLDTRQSIQLGRASSPRWSPDGQWIAYEAGGGVTIAKPDGSGAVLLAPVGGTNHPLPSSGDRLTWSPDSKSIAFISASPGPEADANGDPMVITRYLYKPTASEGMTRFNDNRRLHIFIVDVATKAVRQLTSGSYYEHSIDWSPDGGEILFVSNHEADSDRIFNYDIFAANAGTGAVRRITDTKNAEYRPVWSPDGKEIAFQGTRRTLTSSETTMEDTHVWVMGADGSHRHEVDSGIDNRQGAPRWSPDGKSLYFTVQERGTAHLYRMPVGGGQPQKIDLDGAVGSWSLAKDALACTVTTKSSPGEVYLKRGNGAAGALTSLNRDVMAGKKVTDVESFRFKSVDGLEIEAFLTKPADTTGKHPLIVMMHGGPHGEQGPQFNAKAQVYAAHGYASLMVNYRGSTGYGQKLADAIFGDQNGKEAEDVIAGVDAALARYPWLDGLRMGLEGGSYGGQLANWIITRTPRFKAAIPTAGISNLVTENYVSYYHDYLAVEYGDFPHKNGIIDKLWERSAIRYANQVKTPVLFIHGENDNDVPIVEAEQFYIALKDCGVETVMLRYPREGHGLRETKHVVDAMDRSIAWYDAHFAK